MGYVLTDSNSEMLAKKFVCVILLAFRQEKFGTQPKNKQLNIKKCVSVSPHVCINLQEPMVLAKTITSFSVNLNTF